MINIFAFIISFILALVFVQPLKHMLSKTILLESNFRGEKIPNGMGVGFVFSQFITLSILNYFEYNRNLNLYLLGMVFISFLGLLDDTIGTDEYKGFKGHIGAFLKGKLTTGNLKAILGFFTSLYISSFFSKDYLNLVLNSLLLALSINTMNLFDLRPGRAIKVFCIASFILLTINIKSDNMSIILALLGFLSIYIVDDLKALSMMGDSGSNLLGYSLGFYVVVNFSLMFRVSFLFFVIFLNYLSERKSFSEIISNNKILNYIDMLGR